MKDIVESYIQSVSKKFVHETTSEYGYRTDFELLLKGVFETIKVSRFDNDPKAKEGNKPDFVVIKDDVPLLYIETKDIGVSLDKVEKSEQMSRYYGYANLVLTDYLEFRFYRNGEPYGEPIVIADYDIKNRTINPKSESYEYLAKTLIDFTKSHKEPIKSGKHLAKIMGGKAMRIRDNLNEFLKSGSEKNNELNKLYQTLKKLLVHDMDKRDFSDMYAQTLVYGLFAARFYDETPEDFSRQEAVYLLPKSNPLLRDFFNHIGGPNFDKRLEYIVNELCEVFSHADVEKLMEDYYKNGSEEKNKKDPIIHFYEDFLNEYDPIMRKKMGAYYTPFPVVEFITKSVDEILKKEFDLAKGLADTSKTNNGVHRVQVLDPAVGTGTFYSTVIREIYKTFKGQEGGWPTYVHSELLPRIHGFELMMAPYTIAHLRLALEFRKTKFYYFNNRLSLFLTNSLENTFDQGDLFAPLGFAESLAKESEEAAKIKNDTPIMVVIGNPPYSGVSSNETKYANSLVERYKVEPGGKQRLQERKHWLNDDYVKFIAFAESMIEKTGDGVVAMITNNGYLDNPTFRGMRWHLAKTFDKIYVLDLHGNAKKKETAPDGGKDENVFDIMQGVGIILAVKTGKKKNDELGEVYHADLYGTRKHKFEELKRTPKWQKLTLDSRMLYFVPKDTKGQKEYEKGFKIDKLFLQNVTGIVTMGDDFILDDKREVIAERIRKLTRGEYNESNLNSEFKLGKNYAKFILDNHTKLDFDESKLVKLSYRPFDKRWTYFDNKVLWRWRESIMKHFVNHKNVGLVTTRMQKDHPGAYISNNIIAHKTFNAYDSNSIFPLYIYHDDGTGTPNLKREIVDKIEKIVGKVSPEDIFDYIYATLHSPKYRKKHKEFLKIDFPRVPYPKNKETFKKLVKLGKELRELHLLESSKVNKFITTYPVTGGDKVEKKLEYKDGKVYINDEQYFGNVPEVAWNFWIGGYQPAQKWLKDRKGNTLTNKDIEHYQKMIVALVETEKIMNETDKSFFN